MSPCGLESQFRFRGLISCATVAIAGFHLVQVGAGEVVELADERIVGDSFQFRVSSFQWSRGARWLLRSNRPVRDFVVIGSLTQHFAEGAGDAEGSFGFQVSRLALRSEGFHRRGHSGRRGTRRVGIHRGRWWRGSFRGRFASDLASFARPGRRGRLPHVNSVTLRLLPVITAVKPQ